MPATQVKVGILIHRTFFDEMFFNCNSNLKEVDPGVG